MVSQHDELKCLLDFLFHFIFRYFLQIADKIKVLTHGKLIEEHIGLLAKSHILPSKVDIVHDRMPTYGGIA